MSAVVLGSIAGPCVIDASAATDAHSVVTARQISAALTRAGVSSREIPALRGAVQQKLEADDDSGAPTNPVSFVIDQVLTTVEFDTSASNLQSILWDFPGFGPYGSL